MAKLTSREQALLGRGYSETQILTLGRTDDSVVRETARRLAADFPTGNTSPGMPKCIFLGGQPGSGKSVHSRRITAQAESRYVEIGLDLYRTWHPHYGDIERVIADHWIDRTETENDTPGNDIADFTHLFAGQVTDAVIALAQQRRLDMILEWGLRTWEEPLRMMQDIYSMGYRISICFIAADRQTSLAACQFRADVMDAAGHIMRRVSNEFHELALSTLAESCRRLYDEAVIANAWCDDFRIVDRAGNILWRCGDTGHPAEVYAVCLNTPCVCTANSEAEAIRSADAELRGLQLGRNAQ